MTTVTKNPPSSLYSNYLTSKIATSDKTCNVCQRLLYSFEEILRCRDCYGSYHWRCVQPDIASYFGSSDNYICEKCKVNSTTTTTDSSQPLNNRTNLTDSSNESYLDFDSLPSKTTSSDTTTDESIRKIGDKQSSHSYQITPISNLDDYLPQQADEDEDDYQTSPYNDDSQTTPRIPQLHKQNGIESDEETDPTTMPYTTNYQYTSLKDYALSKIGRTTNNNGSNNHQNAPSNDIDRQPTSRYGGGLQYTNHGYDPTVTRIVGAPASDATTFTSPTVNNISTHNRQQHFINTSNSNSNDKSSRRPEQQHSPILPSSPYLSQNRVNDSPVSKSSAQHYPQQNDRRSTLNSDSGIVMINSSPQQQQQQPQPTEEKYVVEKKLTNLVQELGKQLETDAQKLNDKLEMKLKDLESMIHQQTYIIRKQDEVIENLKSKILHIENERDHFRQRLTIHEQREQEEKKRTLTNDIQKLSEQEFTDDEEDEQSDMKYTNTSTIVIENNNNNNNKPTLSKKTPAPRIDNQWSTTNDEPELTVAKLIKNVPAPRQRLESDSSSAPSMNDKVVSSIPTKEPPAATSRLDRIIHQSAPKDIINPSTSNYSLAQVRHQDRPRILEPISGEQQLVTSVHYDDSDDDSEDNNIKNKKPALKPKRTSSVSSLSSRSSSLQTKPLKTTNSTGTTTTANRNPNKYPSFESLQPNYQNEPGSRLATKTGSLQFGTKPVQNDAEPGTVYLRPNESNYAANQSIGSVKGWLRKQNRDSFLKRVERFYCALSTSALLMHRTPEDRTPHKIIHLKGAKVYYYDDPKYGPSLELTWASQSNEPKHYHLYAPNPQEADRWVTGIQTVIHNLESSVSPSKRHQW